MGIYSNGTIFGIKIYAFSEKADYSTILYEQVYDTIMTDEQKLEAYVFYTEVAHLSNQIRFQVYTECMSTLEPNDKTTFKNWWSISLEQFLEHFNH
jgi:hypothetical protein